MSRKGSISLTSTLNVPVGSHILYFHSDKGAYLQNALSFITMGIQLGQYVLFIEEQQHYLAIREQLERSYEEDVLSYYLHHINRDRFYRTYEDFHFNRVLDNLHHAIQPYLQQQRDVRLWGHVDWKEGRNVVQKLRTYECEADLALNELGFLTVCAYDGMKVPAAIQNELMTSHPYLMTDDSLVLSNLYQKRKNRDIVFPSLSTRAALETEMDFYRQKLDFVHVVSHEVRNPLTVIKSYAKLISGNVQSPRDQERLKLINDYVDLIDNEISHIIYTEEMLSSKALWRRRLISPKDLLENVFAVMEIKARTQNINFRYEMSLTGQETLFANAIGYKLIVSNLFSNAIKYSHEEGFVMCRVHCCTEALHITIEDNGIGMSDEQMQRLFQKYEKMNEERGGQGIGLFMVKKLIDYFDGSIKIASALGAGTRVDVSFPLHVPAAVDSI